MNQAGSLRNDIIQRVLAIDDVEQLKVLKKMVQPSKSPVYKLTALQKELVAQSIRQADSGLLISQEDLENQQQEWLKEK